MARIKIDQLNAWQALSGAYALVAYHVDTALAGAGLPPRSWYETLAALRAAPEGRLKMNALAKEVGISPGGLTRLVDRLEKDGLVERRTCPTDRRAFHISVSPAGEEMAARMWPVYSAALRTSFADALGDDAAPVAESLRRVTEGVACPTEAPAVEAA